MQRIVTSFLCFLYVLTVASAQDDENPKNVLLRLRASNPFFLQSSLGKHAERLSDFLSTELGGEDEFMWRELMEHSESMSISLDTVCSKCSNNCLPNDASPFDIMGSADIGDTKLQGTSTQCGPNCYVLKGSGQDVCEAEDKKNPDAVHFSYTKVSGPFILAAQVCGPRSAFSDMPLARTGLMIRESLDPMAKNIYHSHTPDAQATWSSRYETNGETSCGFHGSPDVPCLWHFLQRFAPDEGPTEFVGYYYYDDDNTCNFQEAIDPIKYSDITFPDEVYVGMAVLYGKENELYESHFNDIHFAVKVPPGNFW
jgi:hypothetical protein